ncbi:MAG TPA: helix-turn-helix domain-containing protein [Jatrophihabitantaceae bacterium]|nr:helix-turn-helix domain-containing protein [Jatrophihabitantaceae bacterium]
MTATRRHLNARQAETVQRIIDAALEELREVGFETLTIRSVAHRASVAPATAYTYFSSKNHLIVETFWRLMNGRDRRKSDLATPRERVCAVFTDLAKLLAGEPELGAAITVALLGPDPDVRQLRHLIGVEINSRIGRAIGPKPNAQLLDALSVVWSGAMLQAGMGHSDYKQLGRRLVAVTKLLMPEPA